MSLSSVSRIRATRQRAARIRRSPHGVCGIPRPRLRRIMPDPSVSEKEPYNLELPGSGAKKRGRLDQSPPQLGQPVRIGERKRSYRFATNQTCLYQTD